MDTVPTHAANPSFAEATRVFARIGLLSFGGPAGQIALMHKILVEEKRWLDEQLVHQRDLPRRPAEIDAADIGPDLERFAKRGELVHSAL